MNGDPYRAPQSADRRVINRSGQAYQRTEEQSQPEKVEQQKTAPRSSGSHRSTPEKKGSKKGLLWAVGIALLVVIVAFIGWFVWSNAKSADTGINTSRYQAVFLVNGQIYFGKLADANEKSFKLTNIYYPQAQSTAGDAAEETDTQTQSGGIQLIKLGDEVHGPESEMYISKDQILYYENLKDDSKVTKLIEQNEK